MPTINAVLAACAFSKWMTADLELLDSSLKSIEVILSAVNLGQIH